MKTQTKIRSNQKPVVLMLAGALALGMGGCSCSRRVEVVNNTYDTDRGYYHSETGGWYPYPYNHYVVGFGYYGGPRGWSITPYRLTRIVSVPSYNYVRVSVTPGVAIPAPRSYQQTTIHNYNTSSSTASKYSSPTVNSSGTRSVATPSGSSRIGGFGSSASGHSSGAAT